jgi:two-component system, OmpR family, sensor histidine kinase KdpD
MLEKRDNAERRPSPDALLREAQQVEQGRLKIFLGAAPGVGKTYEMLAAARAPTRFSARAACSTS